MLKSLRSFFAPRRVRPRNPRPTRLALEHLETRLAPAVTVGLSGGVLSINADTTTTNNVAVVEASIAPTITIVKVTENGGNVFVTRDFAVSSIVYNGSTNADVFDNQTGIPAAIHGHGSGDSLTGGFSGQDVITETSNRATFGSRQQGDAFVGTLDTPITLTDNSLTAGLGRVNYVLNNVHNVQLTCAGPLSSLFGDTFDLTGFSGSATLTGTAGGTYRLGSGRTTVNAAPAPTLSSSAAAPPPSTAAAPTTRSTSATSPAPGCWATC